MVRDYILQNSVHFMKTARCTAIAGTHRIAIHKLMEAVKEQSIPVPRRHATKASRYVVSLGDLKLFPQLSAVAVEANIVPSSPDVLSRNHAPRNLVTRKRYGTALMSAFLSLVNSS